MKTTLEEKLRLVKLHIYENVPIFEIERKYGLNHSTLKYYCALYRKWGEEAFTKQSGIEVIYSDENIWLTQRMMALLYNVETNTINYHLKKLFSTSELNENQVVRNFRITATDGKQYNAFHYNLKAIVQFVRLVSNH